MDLLSLMLGGLGVGAHRKFRRGVTVQTTFPKFGFGVIDLIHLHDAVAPVPGEAKV